jgi:hypothetical protein
MVVDTHQYLHHSNRDLLRRWCYYGELSARRWEERVYGDNELVDHDPYSVVESGCVRCFEWGEVRDDRERVSG